jgi:hypothetical protein
MTGTFAFFSNNFDSFSDQTYSLTSWWFMLDLSTKTKSFIGFGRWISWMLSAFVHPAPCIQ